MTKSKSLLKESKAWVKAALVTGSISLFVCLYYYGASAQARRFNTVPNEYGQGAYMKYAIGIRESGCAYIGDRNRMPVYPFLQSLFYRRGMTGEEFFEIGKRNNIVLSLILLGLLLLVFRRYLQLHTCLNLFLITAFDVFVFKAGYFQCELLYYVLSFCAFLLMCKLVVAPTAKLGISTGILLGLAHLTKAAVLPAIVLLMTVLLLAESCRWYRERNAFRSPQDREPRRHGSLPSLLCVGIFFLAVVYPYISTSKRVFGSYFYNVNTTFYLWYDSWEQAKTGTRSHGDREGPVQMSPEDIPGPSKYLREHTLSEIGLRVLNGARKTVSRGAKSYGYFKYFALYSALSLCCLWQYPQRSLNMLAQRPVLTLFVIAYFALYFLSYAWYAPIASGTRFTLALFVPFMFSVSYYLQANGDMHLNLRGINGKLSNLVNYTVSALLVVDIVLVLSYKIVQMRGGH